MQRELVFSTTKGDGDSMETIDLKQLERNIFREYVQDGLTDLIFGAYFLLLGLLLQTGGTVAPFIVLYTLFFVPLLRALKKRVTYPRTGYVELRQGDPAPLPSLVLGAVALGLVTLVVVLIAVGAIADPAQWYRWMPIFFGIVVAGILIGLGLKVRLVRYHVVAAVALVGGPAATLLPLAGKLAHIGLFMAAIGALILSGGVLALARFVRTHPRLSEEGAGAID
jgi:hypothetical protein